MLCDIEVPGSSSQAGLGKAMVPSHVVFMWFAKYKEVANEEHEMLVGMF